VAAKSTTDDARWMRRAIEHARRGLGRTNPNPIVGACIVSDEGVVLGQGAHEIAGGPHAEINALDEAGADVRQRDADRRQYLERYYHKETNDPYLYDLQINTATITLDVAAQMVVRLIRPDGVAA